MLFALTLCLGDDWCISIYVGWRFISYLCLVHKLFKSIFSMIIFVQWLRYWIDVKLVKKYKCKSNMSLQYMIIYYPRRRINFSLRNEYDISISIQAGSKINLRLLNTCFMNSLTFKSFFSYCGDWCSNTWYALY